jgi:hypothetical protein
MVKHTGFFLKSRSFKQPIMSGGSFLLSRGGAGNASSYSSPEEMKAITGMGMHGRGMSGGRMCGGKMQSMGALQSLEIRHKGKKPSNIKF